MSPSHTAVILFVGGGLSRTVTATDLDRSALATALDEDLAPDVTAVEVVADGLNLILDVSAVGGESYVLRRPNKLRETDYMNDLATEYAVLERLVDTPVPAPEPVLYRDDVPGIEGPCYVMTRLDGDPVPLGEALPERFRGPAARATVAESLVDALADVHAVETDPLAPALRRRTPRESVATNRDRLDRAAETLGVDLPRLRAVGERLLDAAPADPDATLIHGDFRPGNCLFAGAETPTITGVLDWETASLGDPLTDLGYLLLRWRDDGDATPDLDEIASLDGDDDVRAELRAANEHGLAPFTSKPGSPTRTELVARYEDRTGRTFDDERFHRGYAAFALATVWVDLRRGAVETGEPSAWNWQPNVEYLALLAEGILDGEFEL